MTAFKPLRGVISPTLTPFNDDMTIAEDLYIAHAKRCLADGCVGLAPFGTTSEALSVGIDERVDMLEKLVASGIAASKLIPGTGLTNLPDTIRLTRHAVELGCSGAMTLPPFYFKNVADEGLYDYFCRLIDGVADDRLNIYLYHIPQVSGVGIPVPLAMTVVRAQHGSVVGWMWGVSSAFNVLGAMSFVPLTQVAGISFALQLVGLLYLIAGVSTSVTLLTLSSSGR